MPLTSAMSNVFAGSVRAASFTGDGSGLTNVAFSGAVSAANITSGKMADARLSSNVPLKDATQNVFSGTLRADAFAGDGSGLTNIQATGVSASSLTAGTLSDARLSNSVPLKDAASSVFQGAVTADQLTTTDTSGVVLNVTGRALISQAGVVAIPARETSIDVTAGTISPDAVVIAQVTGAANGMFVAATQRLDGGKFRVTFNKSTTLTSLKLAYFIIG